MELLLNGNKETNCIPDGFLDSPDKELDFTLVTDSPHLRRKIRDIESLLCKNKFIDVETMRKYAISEGGFVNDTVRKRCWPLLLGLDPDEIEEAPSEEMLHSHVEFTQVVLDVNRSLKRFPPGIPYEQRVALQDQLTNLILRVITKYPHLRYYQGYHDVAVTFLLVVGEDDAFRIMEKLSTNNLRDCMEPTMEKTSHLLNYIYPLIRRLNPKLYKFLEKSGVGTLFCLPWFLTWFGHNLTHYKDVVRLYDFFLAMPPLTPIYLSAVLVVYRQDAILSVECDMAAVHCALSLIPDELPFEKIILNTIDLYERYPPKNIEKEVIDRTNKEKLANAPRRPQNNSVFRNIVRYNWFHYLLPIYRSKTQIIILAFGIAWGLYSYLKKDPSGPTTSDDKLLTSFPPIR